MKRRTNTTTYPPTGKSDNTILPGKQANKANIDAAESVEGRVLTKRNFREPDRVQAQDWNSTMSRLARVREAATRKDAQPFTSLFHHITLELLRASFYQLNRKAACDGITWFEYEEDLENRLIDLHDRLHCGRYKPRPAKRVFIEKEDGSKRPLSIQCLDDKIAQQAVVMLLNEIYETEFLGFSYGFRPHRSQHDALDGLAWGIVSQRVNWVLDLDIEKFFDTVEHDRLIQMIQHRVTDGRIIRLIRRWIKVGIREDEGKRQAASCGIAQGAVISPLLANIYLHYVFDLWTHQWRQRYAEGRVIVVRYADDGVLGFNCLKDAKAYHQALQQRMSKFGLALHPKKTRLIRFGRFAAANGKGKPETFEFLGFTHYCGTRFDGKFRVGRRTSRRRLHKRIKAITYELRRRMHAPIIETLRWLKLVIQGHFNYYGVPGNTNQLAHFRDELVRRVIKLLRRRSQRSKIRWDTFGPVINGFLPRPRVMHPYPERRFNAKYSR